VTEKLTYTYHYDKEADVLYLSFAPGEKATTVVELNDNILLRFNRTEKRAVGLITSPPVNQVLKVSTYTPSLTNQIPVVSVEKPPFSLPLELAA
jgi:hypothetical protein